MKDGFYGISGVHVGAHVKRGGTDHRRCDRCGFGIRRSPGRERIDGLMLCKDCGWDSVYIEAAGRLSA